jgi:16S rRNA (guanine527-N7)-methyltransferase
LLLGALASEPAPPTTVKEPDEAVDVHVADSLSGLTVDPLAQAARIADIGAGAGFPGLVLAVALPSASVDLIESTARKCEVIERLATAAGIENARPVAARAEEWAAGDGRGAYDVVTARALAGLPVLAEYAAPLLREGGVLVAWKGARDPVEERDGASAAAILGLELDPPVAVRPFKASRDRHLYVFRKTAPTPARFPRRAGMATKRPLPDPKVRG